MVDSVNVSGLTIAGRIDAPDPKNGQVAIQKNLDMSGAKSYSIDFNSINQQQQIGVIRTMFCDNSNNPSEIVVTALGTGQRFTIPAYAEGYFPIVSRLNAGIVLESDGGTTKPVIVIFFNYDFPIGVWYKYGAVNKDVAQKTQGALPDGSDVGGQYGNGNIIAGRDPNGKVKTVATDANGALMIANLNVTIGAVFGVDAVGVVPTKAPNLFAVLDKDGKVAIPALTPNSELKTKDADVATKLDTLNTTLARPSNAARTAVVAAVVDTPVLAANVNRKGATIYNDSIATLYLAFGDAAAATNNYTAQVQAGDYFEVPAKFTGALRGIWSAANGSAYVTEIS